MGRGNRGGFAYFTYNPQKVLSEDGYKRLEAISEFTEFGSGFKVAMRDLEIRGSGNVFGPEQHGHIEKVGYELYSKMLNDCLKEIKGQAVEEEIDVQIKVNIDAFLPEYYIENSEDRMTVYKTISSISTEEGKQQIVQELLDRFGKLPLEVQNLVDIAYLKACAKKIGVKEVLMSNSTIKLTFEKPESLLNNKQLNKAINEISSKLVLNFDKEATITFTKLSYSNLDNFKNLLHFLTIASKNEKK